MKRAIHINLISALFLFIFAVKMGISVAPLVYSIDKETVNAAILQLELESNTKEHNADHSKDISKLLKYGSELNHIYEFCLNPMPTNSNLKYFVKPRNYINSFFPSVLTPPPNHLV
ncbi:hypothetical protein FYC62_00440 [Pedobacter aquae]|uniref:Uncharacterized protein n=1 Tax=Pedobacter aquae TaxID=2605747 RepID=A0A5C0VGB1_9SPHI|nr:hypothetical protein [Pedobacter aquae]QEK50300.1 hypothetical protein FYC62_00440 [Pedobacter aquae]